MQNALATAVVLGADKTNYNYKKIEGVFQALIELGFDTHHYTPETSKDGLISHKNIDVVFAEMNVAGLPLHNVKKLIIWCNINLLEAIGLAAANPGTRIIVAPKSYMLSSALNKEYAKKFGTYDYQKIDYEGQDLDIFEKIIRTASRPIDSTTYQISDNLFYVYGPCSLAMTQNVETTLPVAEYKFAYFGTGSNRPGVVEALQYIESKRLAKTAVHFAEGGPIHPDTCIDLYKKSQYVLHEQVMPVVLEHPVRLGEASSCGCEVLSIENISLIEHTKGFVPGYTSFRSVHELISNLDRLPDISLEARMQKVRKFSHTYVAFLQKLLQVC